MAGLHDPESPLKKDENAYVEQKNSHEPRQDKPERRSFPSRSTRNNSRPPNHHTKRRRARKLPRLAARFASWARKNPCPVWNGNILAIGLTASSGPSRCEQDVLCETAMSEIPWDHPLVVLRIGGANRLDSDAQSHALRCGKYETREAVANTRAKSQNSRA